MTVRKLQPHFLGILLAISLTFSCPLVTFASVFYNEETGYEVYIEDEANLLSSSETEELLELMQQITVYGNVAFLSTERNTYGSAERYAENYGNTTFGMESYTLFLIDMDCREICVYSNGEIYKTITSSYADTITDNVYTYASKGDYYSCVYHAFEQIYTLLDGRSIAQPMKYISNLLLSIVLALLINYGIVMSMSRSKKASDRELLNEIERNVNIENTRMDFLHQTKQFSPQAPPPSAKSGGGHGGGSHGGGGGSHKF